VLTAFGLNVPLGAWRVRCRKFSLAWFVAIHASIPAIVATRLALGIGWSWVPVLIATAVLGQLTGGALFPAREASRH
jgi:hypothetical protein